MRKTRIERIIAVMLSIMLLSSCGANELGGVSSNLPQQEDKNQSIVSSVAEKEENEQKTPSPDKEKEETNKEETDKEQKESEKPETEDTSSNKEQDKTNSNSKDEKTNSDASSPKEDKDKTPGDNTSSSTTPVNAKPNPNKVYEVPENNPQPVIVDRENAAVPTPISYSKKMIGVGVDFEHKSISGSSEKNEEWTSHIAIIKSLSELEEIYRTDGIQKQDEEKDYSKFYSEDFFDDNVVIMLSLRRGSANATVTVRNITRQDGRMYIEIDNEWPKYQLPMETHHRLFVSVPKWHLEKVKDIVVCQD